MKGRGNLFALVYYKQVVRAFAASCFNAWGLVNALVRLGHKG